MTARCDTEFAFEVVYMFAGVAILCCNLLLFGGILFNRSLLSRKEYLIISGVALADMIAGVASLWAAIYRVKTGTSNCEHQYNVTRLECVENGVVPLFAFAAFLQGLMQLLLTVDRLIAVSAPFLYLSLNHRYTFSILAFAYIFSALWTGCGVGVIYWTDNKTDLVPSECTLLETLDDDGHTWLTLYHHLYFAYRLLFSASSIALYIIVLFLLFSRQRLWHEQTRTSTTPMVTLTVTVFYCCVATFFLDLIPMTASALMRLLEKREERVLVTMILWPLMTMFPLSNVAIYMWRHAEIRAAVRHALRCKQLGPDLTRFRRRRTQDADIIMCVIMLDH